MFQKPTATLISETSWSLWIIWLVVMEWNHVGSTYLLRISNYIVCFCCFVPEPIHLITVLLLLFVLCCLCTLQERSFVVLKPLPPMTDRRRSLYFTAQHWLPLSGGLADVSVLTPLVWRWEIWSCVNDCLLLLSWVLVIQTIIVG